MPPAAFEPAIPASERPHIHALDRVATGLGEENINRKESVDSNHRTAVANMVMNLRLP